MAPDLVPQGMIEQKIFLVRGHKVMLSNDLAELYQVEAKRLIQAVKRNKARFPEDFMFQLTWEEMKFLRSQFVTLNNHDPEAMGDYVMKKRGQHPKYLLYAGLGRDERSGFNIPGTRSQFQRIGSCPPISVPLFQLPNIVRPSPLPGIIGGDFLKK